MKTAFALAIVFITFSMTPAQSKKPAQTPCSRAKTQSELEDCFCDRASTADNKLNLTYQQLLKKNASDNVFVEKLKASQRAWLAFRDAQLEAIYPEKQNPRAKYGSVFNMCLCMAQEELIVARIKQLTRMLQSEEGDVCGWDIH